MEKRQLSTFWNFHFILRIVDYSKVELWDVEKFLKNLPNRFIRGRISTLVKTLNWMASFFTSAIAMSSRANFSLRTVLKWWHVNIHQRIPSKWMGKYLMKNSIVFHSVWCRRIVTKDEINSSIFKESSEHHQTLIWIERRNLICHVV